MYVAPPGTSALMNKLISVIGFSGPGCGALVVTTPQQISTKRAQKDLLYLKKLRVPVLGVIENMVAVSKYMHAPVVDNDCSLKLFLSY